MARKIVMRSFRQSPSTNRSTHPRKLRRRSANGTTSTTTNSKRASATTSISELYAKPILTTGMSCARKAATSKMRDAQDGGMERGTAHDQVEISSNNELIVRLQHAMGNVRGGLLQNGLNYKWFKIRTTNNIDRF